MSAVWLQGLDITYLSEQVLYWSVLSHHRGNVILTVCGVLSLQALGEPLMREVVGNYCQSVMGAGQLQGEALLASFKPRGYSECIVIAGGEDRK